jgi:hypothetical protein
MTHHHKAEIDMAPSSCDGYLFFKRLGRNLVGLSATYVDDYLRAGTPQFIKCSSLTGKRFESRKAMGVICVSLDWEHIQKDPVKSYRNHLSIR